MSDDVIGGDGDGKKTAPNESERHIFSVNELVSGEGGGAAEYNIERMELSHN